MGAIDSLSRFMGLGCSGRIAKILIIIFAFFQAATKMRSQTHSVADCGSA